MSVISKLLEGKNDEAACELTEKLDNIRVNHMVEVQHVVMKNFFLDGPDLIPPSPIVNASLPLSKE